MTIARNPGDERADEEGWPWSHRKTLTAEVHRRIARIVRWLTRSRILALEALEQILRIQFYSLCCRSTQ